MPAKLINGTALSQTIKADVRTRIAAHTAAGERAPFLAVVLVGDNPASQIYVGHKEKACAEVGIKTRTWKLPKTASQAEVLELVERLNADPAIDGILPQLPLPPQVSRIATIHAISPEKDVDGLTPYNQGMLDWNLPARYPCTPLGIMALIRSTGIKLSGSLAGVLGRSVLVGAPTATLLSHAGSTIVCMHSESRNTRELTRECDIVVVATGSHHLVKGDWIKPGAVVIDVGIHRTESGKLAGDVDFDAAAKVAGHITPVPGGVGPMTIAMLLVNCLDAYEARKSKKL